MLPFGMRQGFLDKSMRSMLPLNREIAAWSEIFFAALPLNRENRPRTLQQSWGDGDGRGAQDSTFIAA
jgi:hypothetical protein